MTFTSRTHAVPASAPSGRAGPSGVLDPVLRLVAVLGLAYSAYAHWHLRGSYTGNRTSTLSQADVFAVQAIACVVVAALLVLTGSRRPLPGWASLGVWVLAFAVSAGSLTAVLLYRYVDIGRLGPLPDMYEPAWYALKTRSAVAEAAATVASLAGLGLTWWTLRAARRAAAPGR